MRERGFEAASFQREVWNAVARGESGLLHAGTGSGKTYAVWLGVLEAFAPIAKSRGLRVLWVTPMRALAADTLRTLACATEELCPAWEVGARTGDTTSTERARQSKHLPEVLVTTPESLTLLLARDDSRALFFALDAVIVDEWHELLSNKRGVQTQLALARLRRFSPRVLTWGLSATLGDVELARDALLGVGERGTIVTDATPKPMRIDTLVPEKIERFPWGGHLGLRQLAGVVREIEAASTTLVFCNVRSAAELWYRALLAERPEWAGRIALHHGSMHQSERDFVERSLKEGSLRAVVCTSSLDLGVDFLPVERVLQIGSPKGVARLLQRAGRSGHAPGRVSRATLVPTNALEIVEAAAVRRGVAAGRVESSRVPKKPFDVLVQHVVTCALGGGFRVDELFDEVRTTHAYRDLSRPEFDWVVAFATNGGNSLEAYPEHHRLIRDEEMMLRVATPALARRHRMSIGTIVADAMIRVQMLRGRRLGSIEEAFVSMLRQGDTFLFSGRELELVRIHEMTAWVRAAKKGAPAVPRWNGSRMAFSEDLAECMLDVLGDAGRGLFVEPEMQAVRPLLELQQRWSALPTARSLVLEQIRTREGHHLFCYPFAGRIAHIGLSALFAHRVTRGVPGTFSISVNDYGFELLSAEPVDWKARVEQGLFATENLFEDVIASLKGAQLALRRFREIARIAGLVFSGFPGQPKSARQLQASSSLFFEVFQKYDPSNLLLSQAERESLDQELEIGRLGAILDRMRVQTLVMCTPPRPTPFAFPLLVGRLRERFSNEEVSQRVQRMLLDLERVAASEEGVRVS